MRYCFVDQYPEVLRQYPAGIARALAAADPQAELWFVYNENVGSINERSFPHGSKFLYSGAPTYKNIDAVLARLEPDVLVFTAQRVSDSAFVAVARLRGIPTIMFQHGLYVPFLRREPFFVVRKAVKMIRYSRYAGAIARAHKLPRLRYLIELAGVFLLGKPYARARIDHDGVKVDRVLIHGEYWRRWHTQKYGYCPEQQVVVGYPDFGRLKEIREQPPTDAVCYVAQTLVEDGRMQRRTYQRFLRLLGDAVEGRALVVKLHPRSDEQLYAKLQSQPNVTLQREAVPNAVAYIGHYSTLLILVPFLTRNLLLWTLDGHDIPPILPKVAARVTGDHAVMRDFAKCAVRQEPDAQRVAELQEYFWDNPNGAYEAAAREIMAMAARESKEPRAL